MTIQPPCDQTAIQDGINALQPAGGTLTFNCGTAAILISSQFNIYTNIHIDGAQKITLTGGNTSRLFNVLPGASLTLSQLVLTNGRSDSKDGGAVYVAQGALRLNRVTIQNSTAGAGGGAVKLKAGTLEIVQSVIQNNSAGSGGGISGYGVMTLSQSTIAGNVASLDGGGLDISGTITIQNSLILSNAASLDELASEGGGMVLRAPATTLITESRIAGNSAYYCGGLTNHGRVTLNHVLIEDNAATVNGGGLCAFGEESVSNTSIVNNQAYNSSAFGTAGNGGGIVRSGLATTSVYTNVTLSGNVAGAYGGGIYAFNGSLRMTFATIYSNTALSSGGGIYQSGSQNFVINLKNTLVGNNAHLDCAQAPEVMPMRTISSFNVASDTTCPFNDASDTNGATPNLGPLVNNGGLTPTHMPLPNSRLVDTGQCVNGVVTDQRGAPRLAGATCDIGAVEYGATLPRIRLPIVVH